MKRWTLRLYQDEYQEVTVTLPDECSYNDAVQAAVEATSPTAWRRDHYAPRVMLIGEEHTS